MNPLVITFLCFSPLTVRHYLCECAAVTIKVPRAASHLLLKKVYCEAKGSRYEVRTSTNGRPPYDKPLQPSADPGRSRQQSYPLQSMQNAEVFIQVDGCHGGTTDRMAFVAFGLRSTLYVLEFRILLTYGGYSLLVGTQAHPDYTQILKF